MIILVVEDNPLNLELVTDLLEMSGHTVIPADSGEVALEIAGRQALDLILMDVSLPGKDGLTITAELKAEPKTRHIPVIAVTAHSMAKDRERIVAAGCDGYVTKPIDAQTFASEIEKFKK
ncbi:MAG: response regulator [Candidatus Eremiobacteraeota bacterium]|nr:response regulator [Candidatus Eremiobacteraeota bacterium]MCW5872521.1 response regulator [Candidatus Eremiobacteraeota bacterium]